MNQEDLDFNIKIKSETETQKTNSTKNKNNNENNEDNNNKKQEKLKGMALFNISKAAHKIGCLFTFLFKILSIIFYLFCNLFIKNTIITFVIVISFSALDFWTVKNVTGRLLVGLRWWNELSEDGKESWQFETMDANQEPHSVDAAIFWGSQVAACIFWGFVLFFDLLLFRFYWAMVAIVAFGLILINLIGYYKCRGGNI